MQIEKQSNFKIGNYRWRICALLFFATTINYLDRQVLGILAPYLQDDLGWNEIDYGNIVAAFKIAYALGMVGMGNLLDRLGSKKGFSLAIIIWSLASMLHALARSVWGFASARFMLGLGESANFPASVKTVAEWFPQKERALAVGIFNSGTNVGSILAPLVVPALAVALGWQWAFILTGLTGFIWLIFWMTTYRKPEEHPKLSAAELAHIVQDGEESSEKIPWIKLIPHRQTLTVCLLKFFTDPVWWFFLFWLPKFLYSNHGITIMELGPPLITIYVVSDLGSIAGGWLSSYFIKKGRSADFARKTTILIAAVCAVPIAYASRTGDLWTAVALISLGTAAHQACSANIYTIVSDVFPKRAVASVIGIIGMSGAIGGVIVAPIVGFVLETTGSYMLIFSFFSVMYLLAWGILKIGIKEIKPIQL